MTAEWGDVTRFPGAGELMELAERFVKSVRDGFPLAYWMKLKEVDDQRGGD
jgi:hypothetical protein